MNDFTLPKLAPYYMNKLSHAMWQPFYDMVHVQEQFTNLTSEITAKATSQVINQIRTNLNLT
jgi:hypothetical protein